MRAYVIRRLLLMIPTLFVVTFIIFWIVSLIPGDIIDAMTALASDIEVDREAMEKSMGLDAPLPVQYLRWLGIMTQPDGSFNGVLQGNLGRSWWQSITVAKAVALRWPVTLELGLMGILISQLIALPIAFYSALRQDSWGDYIGRTFAILCISVPNFWFATLILVFPSIWWGYMPPIMLIRFSDDPLGNLAMFVVPAAVLGMSLAGLTMRMARTMMLEVLRQDYIRTAWAKGLKERVIIRRHALKNALIPVVTLIGLQMPYIFGGAVIIERIFCLPGMGCLILDAIIHRDQPLACGVLTLFAAVLVLINLLVDLTYAYLDPRIRL